jgi:hypothetical protein
MSDTDVQDKATVTLDGVEHIIEDLPDAAKYCLAQIEDINNQTNGVKAKLDQLMMAERGFIAQLKIEVAPKEEPTKQ